MNQQPHLIGNIESLPEHERYIFALVLSQLGGHKCSRELTEALSDWRKKLRK